MRSIILSESSHGVILPGIVGSGKTHLLGDLCRDLETQGYQLFQYEGDDSKFRARVRASSSCILDDIRSSGSGKPFIYVDEVQKEPEIFVAVKLAHDKLSLKFVVSGSNPAFLRTIASDRLQRRALVVPQFPLSMQEILEHHQLCDDGVYNDFLGILSDPKDLSTFVLSRPKLVEEVTAIAKGYLVVGGLPQAWLAPDLKSAMTAVKLVAERGITETYQTTIAADDEVRQFLANRNSQEFAYKGVQQSLRSTKRTIVDRVIDHLMNYGYLFKKTPFLDTFTSTHSTYFATYSWVDPGLVSYYTSAVPTAQELGFRLESYIHTRLVHYLAQIPQKSSIYYYKPFTIKPSNNALSFGPGEIDFVIKLGRTLIPIEVKMTTKHAEIDTSLLEDFVQKYQAKFGIVLYGGSSFVDLNKQIIYLPFWGI